MGPYDEVQPSILPLCGHHITSHHEVISPTREKKKWGSETLLTKKEKKKKRKISRPNLNYINIFFIIFCLH